MEANYSNYDRSQIKLKFKAPNKPQRGKKHFSFFFLISVQRRREGGKAVKRWGFRGGQGWTVAHSSKGLELGIEKKKKKRANIKNNRKELFLV